MDFQPTDRRSVLLATATVGCSVLTGCIGNAAPGATDDAADSETPASETSTSVQVGTTAGQRQYSVTRSAITGVGGDMIGYSYRFEDITDRETRKQRLQVLNRVIRHNLRNDLDAIRGFAETIQAADLDADEARTYFTRIEGLAEDVIDTAEAVDRSRKLLSERQLRWEDVSLEQIATEVAADSEVDVSLRRPCGSVTVHSNGDVVRLIIGELLDNAVKHTTSDNPRVGITVEPTADGGRITVWDDGPGIPAHERSVLFDREETPDKHGSGVGLWLVTWAVDRLGGTLDFGDRDPRGSTVMIQIPDQQNGSSERTRKTER